jgi:hypothetical protein
MTTRDRREPRPAWTRPTAAVIRSSRVLAGLLARVSDGPDGAVDRVAERDVARLHRLLAEELKTVMLSEPEARMVLSGVTALRGSRAAERPLGSLWEAVESECRRLLGLHVYDGVRAADLVPRLRALSRAQTLALIDAGERARILSGRMGPDYRRGGEGWLLRAVGLVRDEPRPGEGDDDAG